MLIIAQGEGNFETSHQESFTAVYTLPDGINEIWIANLELYFSETCTEDFYKVDHPKNAGMYQRVRC